MPDGFSKDDICAVIVTYNPNEILIENIKSLRNQVGQIVIIDNGSDDDTYIKTLNESVIRLGKNYGIAYALNRGIEYCKESKKPLILTMDQDTVLDRDAVQELLKVINETDTASVGINWDGKAEKNETVTYLITSGNLLVLDVLVSVGGYDEKLFIDSVDFDLSLRLTDNGYRMTKVFLARAKHHLGERQGESGYITHSAQRYYYIFRNHFYLTRKFRKTHRAFCLKKDFALGYDILRILLYDKERKQKTKVLVQAYRDSREL